MLGSNSYKVDKYYTVENYLKSRLRCVGRQLGYTAKSIEEHNAWKNEVRQKLWEISGLNSMQGIELSPMLVEKIEFEDYIREKLVIQTEPDIFMPFYVLIPKDIKKGEKRPVVIAPHGHGTAGKVTIAGVREFEGIDKAILKYNGDYGLQLVKEGFIVFCPDARGFGERREPHLQSSEPMDYLDEACTACSVINRMAIALGQTVIGMWTWDLMRLIDYIEGREECNADRIGCAGLSGGGMQTLWLAALDNRIKACIVSGYFYGLEEALLEINNCSCNYVPHLWECLDIGDFGALIAPRDLIIESGTEDKLNGKNKLGNVIPQIEITKQAYQLFDAQDNLVHDIFEGEHQWHGIISIPKLKDVL